MTPERTSPVPAEASCGGPCTMTRVRPAGATTTVDEPLSSTTCPVSAAALRAAATAEPATLARRAPQQRGQLADVGSEHESRARPQAGRLPREREQPVGVEHRGNRALENDPPHGRGGVPGPAQPGTDHRGPQALVRQSLERGTASSRRSPATDSPATPPPPASRARHRRHPRSSAAARSPPQSGTAACAASQAAPG